MGGCKILGCDKGKIKHSLNEHPRVCSKLLNHGDSKHTRWGCDGTSCKKAHPKMCTSSMSSRKCWKLCDKGWHVKGTQFENGQVPVQPVPQHLRAAPNTASLHEFPPMQPLQNGLHSNKQPHNITPNATDDFRCDECPAMFKYKNELRNHMNMQHSLNHDFKCDECAASFKSKSDLGNHKKRMHGTSNEFKCEECAAEFEYKGELRNHINKVHGNTEHEKEAHF